MTEGKFDYSNLGSYYTTMGARLLRARNFKARVHKGVIKVVVPKGIGTIKIEKANNLMEVVKRL